MTKVMSNKDNTTIDSVVSDIMIDGKRHRKRINKFDIVYKWHDPLDVISLKVPLK